MRCDPEFPAMIAMQVLEQMRLTNVPAVPGFSVRSGQYGYSNDLPADPHVAMAAVARIMRLVGEGLMHDKFVVIDRSEVWLGSMNYTFSGTYDDNNNLVHIRSVKMAENYTKEFEEMFLDDMFGDHTVPETPNPDINIEGSRVETFFSPDDGVADHLYEILADATDSIYFMAFSFTTDDLGEVIRAQAENGLDVAGVMEEQQVNSNIGTEYDLFKQAGLKVFLDGNEGQMHHKTMIIDGQIVVTGSYNFSRSAETRNDENLIVIYNKQIADFFMGEFQRIYTQSQQ